MILHDSRIVPVPLRRPHDMPASQVSCALYRAEAGDSASNSGRSPQFTPSRAACTRPAPATRRCTAISDTPRATPHRNRQPQPHLAQLPTQIALSPTTRITPAPANRRCTRIPDFPQPTSHRSCHIHPQPRQHDETTAPSPIPRARPTPANRGYAAISHSPQTTPRSNRQHRPHLAQLTV